jgi:hypothetical protein
VAATVLVRLSTFADQTATQTYRIIRVSTYPIYHETLYYNTIHQPQYAILQYNTIQYNTIQYNTIQYNTIQYNTTQHNTTQYNTIQYNTIQYTIQPHTTKHSVQHCSSAYHVIPSLTHQHPCVPGKCPPSRPTLRV